MRTIKPSPRKNAAALGICLLLGGLVLVGGVAIAIVLSSENTQPLVQEDNLAELDKHAQALLQQKINEVKAPASASEPAKKKEPAQQADPDVGAKPKPAAELPPAFQLPPPRRCDTRAGRRGKKSGSMRQSKKEFNTSRPIRT